MHGNGVTKKVLTVGRVVEMIAGPKADALESIKAHIESGGTLDEGAKRQVDIHFGPDALK
jgi:hypothetical protein